VGGIVSAVPLPSKAALDAETDQAMAAFREHSAEIEGTFDADLAHSLAEQLGAQFGAGCGRLVFGAAQAAGCFEKVMREDYRRPFTAFQVLALLALAGSLLDQEAGQS
jgi:hypothetical protein